MSKHLSESTKTINYFKSRHSMTKNWKKKILIGYFFYDNRIAILNSKNNTKM